MVGLNDDESMINTCYATGNITGFNQIGGLVGYNSDDCQLNFCFASVDVTGSTHIGGLVGGTYSSTLSESYAVGNVEGTMDIGGLVGNNSFSTLSDSYATGSVNGELVVGGLVGRNDRGVIINSYAIGSVFSEEYCGGLVGWNYIGAQINNSIWNVETSGQTIGVVEHEGSTITNLLGLTSLDMQMMNTYTDIGWDFVGEEINGTDDIWEIDNTLNTGYPYISDMEWSFDIGGQGLPDVVMISEVSVRPNPFNQETRICFKLSEPVEKINVIVYNIRGQKVWEKQIYYAGSGEHAVIWSGQDQVGHKQASGVYLFQINNGHEPKACKMILLK
ncbi:MAG: T9SS type A sorting domain-containing protein [Candidatus Cloacimonetes bacterium]|nr:T9SS type A sorting domain-containing protein [Candidatus Cloacimonadota bacterium]